MRKLCIAVILFVMIGVFCAYCFGEEYNHYNEITTMLELPQVPYPSPVNIEQREANLAYISQNIRAILRENQAVIDRVKRVIYAERRGLK